jgi:GMP synthase-like glutamine amidotransferase
VLGVCFGGQLLAAAHGGSVERATHPELGWYEVGSDDEKLVPGGRWFQWHFDRWRLPPGAVEIARNPANSQAFVIGRNLAVQFHPEIDESILAGWLTNGGDHEVRQAGVDPDALLVETRQQAVDGRRRAHHLVDAFLADVATR